MIDIPELESRLKKAQSRVIKAKAAYDSATTEVSRLETTLSVVREMMGATETTSQGGGNLTSRQQIVVNSLNFGQNNALSPVDVFQVASGDASFEGDINYVRTTLWRMADKGVIGNANGAYWRFPPDEQGEGVAASRSETKASASLDWGQRPIVPWDEDSEVPF